MVRHGTPGSGGTLATAAFEEAVAALDPARLVERQCEGRAPLVALAAGKAAWRMAFGAARAGAIGGVVITKDGHARGPLRGFEIVEASHPVPDERSVAAARLLLGAARAVRPDEQAVLLVSGGASALACLPAPGLALADKVAAISTLTAAGVPIGPLNVVRKHLSAVKGGRLAAAIGAPLVALLLSDVESDDPSVIGGGLAAADPSSFADAREIVRQAGVEAALPAAVRAHLEAGADETPKPGNPRLAGSEVRVLAGPDDLGRAASAALTRAGAHVRTAGSRVTCSVEELADRLVREARAMTMISTAAVSAFVAWGEPTLRLPSAPGRGGRAQHTALLVARAISGVEGLTVLCAGSDGTDGPTDIAGAVVDGSTWATTGLAGGGGEAALAAYDSSTALRAAGAILRTGPTGTNVGDLYIVVKSPR